MNVFDLSDILIGVDFGDDTMEIVGDDVSNKQIEAKVSSLLPEIRNRESTMDAFLHLTNQ